MTATRIGWTYRCRSCRQRDNWSLTADYAVVCTPFSCRTPVPLADYHLLPSSVVDMTTRRYELDPTVVVPNSNELERRTADIQRRAVR